MSKSPSKRARLIRAAQELQEATLDALWRQWFAVGASVSTAAAARAVIDPEALVLASLCASEEEPRLADVAAHWALLNGDLLGVQRIKNLRHTFPGLGARLAAFAQLMHDEGRDARWKSLIEVDVPTLPYRRGRARSIRVPFDRPACLMLRLRVLLSVGVKADAVAFLRTHTSPIGYVDSADIARSIAYDPLAVRRVLRVLAEAGWLYEIPDPSPSFSIDETPLGRVLSSVPSQSAQWRYCAGVFAMVTDLHARVTMLPSALSDFAVDSTLDDLEIAHQRVLVDTGVVPPHRRTSPTEQSLDRLEELAKWIRSEI
jgi:hypothetical protein